MAGEKAYYKKFAYDPHPLNWIGKWDNKNKWHPVQEAVIIVHGVKAGARVPVEGGVMAAEISFSRSSGFAMAMGYHRHLERVLIQAEKTKVTLHNNDYFADEFIFNDPKGKEMTRAKLGKYQPDKKSPAFKNQIAHTEQHMPHGESTDSPAFETPGIYTIRSNRYKWKIGYIVVVKNPYAMRSGEQTSVMSQVPTGKYRIEVWHPTLKPKKRFREVTIKEPEDIEKILIEFEMP